MTNDDHVDRKTTLRSTDAPPGERLDGSESRRDHYDRLKNVNSLRWNGKWKDRERETQKNASAILDATASTLELTDYQKREAHRIFSNLPDKFHTAYSTSLLTLCVCGLVGAQDGRRYHPNRVQPDRNYHEPHGFISFFEGLNASYQEFYRCWKRIESEVDY